MADERSIIITLKLEQGDSSENKPTDTSAASQKSDKSSTAKAVAAFAAIQATQIIVGEIVSWSEYFWNRELTLNDDYIGQRNKNIALTQINAGVGAFGTIGSMAVAGAAVGSAGGPWGALIGAAIGTVAAGVKIARSNIQGNDQQNIMLKQMNAQLDFTRARAGWSLKAASIGEDL